MDCLGNNCWTQMLWHFWIEAKKINSMHCVCVCTVHCTHKMIEVSLECLSRWHTICQTKLSWREKKWRWVCSQLAFSIQMVFDCSNGIRLCRKCKQINIKYMLWTCSCSHCALSNSIRISLRIFWQRLWATVFFLSLKSLQVNWVIRNGMKLEK